jgi:hypothetical protein
LSLTQIASAPSASAPSASATILASACGFGQNYSVLSFPSLESSINVYFSLHTAIEVLSLSRSIQLFSTSSTS